MSFTGKKRDAIPSRGTRRMFGWSAVVISPSKRSNWIALASPTDPERGSRRPSPIDFSTST